MSRKLVIALGVVLPLFIFGSLVGSWLMSVNNNCVSYEQKIKKQYEQNKNVYDNYFKTVKEAGQVPEMYIEGLKKVFDSAMTSRYGEEGSRAVFQWIQEQNPQVDPAIYKKIQDIIEAGRNEFSANQTTLLDVKREYETYFGRWPTSWGVRLVGYPRINLADYGIVTSAKTEEEFKNKKSEPIQLK